MGLGKTRGSKKINAKLIEEDDSNLYEMTLAFQKSEVTFAF